MRNLGLALVLISSITAPHTAWGKKHALGKRGRSAPKTQKHLKRAHQLHDAVAPSSSDALAKAVTDEKRDEKATLTAAAPASNAPLSMDNQSNDDEVPGSRKKR